MNLENVTGNLRPRSPWEATDFGARLVRRDAGVVYRTWFAVTLPLALTALAVTAWTPYGPLAFLLYWWLEPAADGAMLHVVSRRLFGEHATARAALRATPGLAWRNRIFLLTPYRFHAARSIAMPLTQLEGLAGKHRRLRARTLNRRVMNQGFGITIVYHHLLVCLYLGSILIVYALIPNEYQGSVGADWLDIFWSDDTRAALTLAFIISYAAQSVLEPWFVGAGFGLYINNRTHLEAWDLEIAFRRIAQRRAACVAATLLLAVALPLAAGWPDAARAQAVDTAYDQAPDPGFAGFWNDTEIRPVLDDVLASDALRTTREVSRWQRRQTPEPALDETGDSVLARMLEAVGRVLSYVFESALWIALFVLVVALLFVARDRRIVWPRVVRKPAGPARIVLAGGEIDADTLPADIPGEALRRWHAGRRREALSLLYRGSVVTLVERHGLRLPPSATESMCVAAVEQQARHEQAVFFSQLVAAWSRCAYGSRDPSDDFVTSACAEWAQHYGSRR